MATNAILSEEERTMKRTPQTTTAQTKSDGSSNRSPPLASRPRSRRLPRRHVRFRRLEHRRILPSVVPRQTPAPRECKFFDHALQAEQAGYRACLRCRPKAVDGNPQSALVRAMCRYIEQHIEGQSDAKSAGQGVSPQPFHLQRTFKSVLGVSPKAYIDACRLRQVKQNLQAGHSVTTRSTPPDTAPAAVSTSAPPAS